MYEADEIDTAPVLPSGLPPFTHKSLDPEGHDIRLLKIKKKLSYNSLIQCHIHHVNLPLSSSGSSHKQNTPSTAPRFNALSYVWGKEEPSHEILIDGHVHMVRHNLFLFLCQTRHHSWTRRAPIWIDAICINQSNTFERNHQVSRMRDIYAGAQEVFIWLGCWPSGGVINYLRPIWRPYQIPGIEWAIPHIRNVIDSFGRWPIDAADYTRCAYRIAKWTPQIMLKLLLKITKFDKSRKGHAAPEFFFILSANIDYWQRMWVTQECLLARKKHVFLGTEHMSWRKFQARLSLFSSNDFGMTMCSFIDTRLDRKCTTLADYWEVFQNLDCTEARDQLYAFAGLSTNAVPFPIDYGCTDLVAFLNSTFYVCYDFCCKEEENLNKILDFARAVSWIIGTYRSRGLLTIQPERSELPGIDDIWAMPTSTKSHPSGLQTFDLREPLVLAGPSRPSYPSQRMMLEDRITFNEYTLFCLLWPPNHVQQHRLSGQEWLSLLGFQVDDIFLPCTDGYYRPYTIAVVLRPTATAEFMVVGRICCNLYDINWSCENYSDSGLPEVVGRRVEKRWTERAEDPLWQVEHDRVIELVFTSLTPFVILFALSCGLGNAKTKHNFDRNSGYRDAALRLIASDAKDSNFQPVTFKTGSFYGGVVYFDDP